MLRFVRYALLLAGACLGNALSAQDITGTWQGSYGPDQFLQLNVIQNGDRLCGYTWDSVRQAKRDYCKAYFDGVYDRKKEQWVITGTWFIKNSGNHVLSRIVLKMSPVDGEQVLKGTGVGVLKRYGNEPEDDPFSNVPGFPRKDINDLNGIPGEQRGFPRLQEITAREPIVLEKVANMPAAILPDMRSCFLEKQRSPPQLTTIVPPALTVTGTPDKKDSMPGVVTGARKERVISHIDVKDKKIQLQVYDNAIVDGDTVSIFVNDQLVMEHRRLSEKPLLVDIELDARSPLQKIVLFAENLGSIPPNTALLVFTSGGKRYELFAKATLEENAVLYFEYKE